MKGFFVDQIILYTYFLLYPTILVTSIVVCMVAVIALLSCLCDVITTFTEFEIHHILALSIVTWSCPQERIKSCR